MTTIENTAIPTPNHAAINVILLHTKPRRNIGEVVEPVIVARGNDTILPPRLLRGRVGGTGGGDIIHVVVEKGGVRRIGAEVAVVRLPRTTTTILEEGMAVALVDVSENEAKGRGVDVEMDRDDAIIAVAISRIAHETIQRATSRVGQGQKLENNTALFGMWDLELLDA